MEKAEPLYLARMEMVRVNGLHLWQFDQLGKVAGIRHFVTDRDSYADGREFSLSLSSSPDKETIRGNRGELARAMDVPTGQLYFPSQVHGTNIVEITRSTRPDHLLETDALITNQPNCCIAVMSADCVPILLYDTRNKAVGAVHSGWRGTVAHILTKTLQRMAEQYGTRGEEIVAAIGPSVSQPSYEVGEEVVQAVMEAFPEAPDLMQMQSNGKAKLDLWKANRFQLLQFGVKPENIELANLCTVKNNDHFFSARKGDSGRFAAGILLWDETHAN